MTSGPACLRHAAASAAMRWRFRHHLACVAAGALLGLAVPAAGTLGVALAAATLLWDYAAHRIRLERRARQQRERLPAVLRNGGVGQFYREGVEHALDGSLGAVPFGDRPAALVSPVHFLRREHVRHLLEGLALTPARRPLDLGCKEGLIGEVFAGPGIHVTGIDLDAVALRQFGRTTGGAAVQADLARLPLRDASVHTVSLLEVIEHLEDPLAALVEVRRVMRSGGWLFLSTNNRSAVLADHLANPLILAERCLGLYFPRCLPPAATLWERPDLGWAYFHTEFARQDLLALLRRAGLAPAALHTYFFAGGLDAWLARLAPGLTEAGYTRWARRIETALAHVPVLKWLGSNWLVVARAPDAGTAPGLDPCASP